MGNSASSGKSQSEETVDYGHLAPQGVYTGPRDWNHSIVTQLICARKLAPFYRPLEDYSDDWDDDRILAARKDTENSIEESAQKPTAKRPSMLKDPSKPEAIVYRGAVECPICFLYYPPNINHSRCCGQAICTECFVQIKRIDPTTTHLVSEPAACPYCVQDNFGVVYTPPPWRAGIGAENSWSDSPKGSQFPIEGPQTPTHKRRQKSYSADSSEVVTTDHIRPDWEAKLAAVQAAVTRRANRRIIMRQVGDRLIPVGVTSGRVHALSPEEAAAAAEAGESSGNGSRRSRRRQQASPNSPFEQFIGLGGQDLEELMVMEAMRLSLLEHEEQQRKEAEEKKKAATSEVGTSEAGPSTSLTAPVSSPPSNRNSLRANLAPSRSRSPSPGHFVTNDHSSDRLGTATALPHSSTAAAALVAATTATAAAAPSSSNDHVNSPPTITVEQSVETPFSQVLPSHQDSQASSTLSTDNPAESTSLYEQLPSSLESSMEYQPLLSTNTTETTEAKSLAPLGDSRSG